MRRFMKVLAAAVTSVCLLVINLPLQGTKVLADNNVYTFSDNGSEGTLTYGNASIGSGQYGEDFLMLEPGTLEINYTPGDGISGIVIIIRDLDNPPAEGDPWQPALTVQGDTATSDQLVLSQCMQIEEIREGGGMVQLTLTKVYKIEWSSNIIRDIIFFKDANATIKRHFDHAHAACEFALSDHTSRVTIAEETNRDNTATYTGTYYLYNRPAQLAIDNTGDIRGEDLLRLTSVKINDASVGVMNEYDLCVYPVTPRDDGSLKIELTGDTRLAVVIGWINSEAFQDESTRAFYDNMGYGLFNCGSAEVRAIYDENMNRVNTYYTTDGCILSDEFEIRGHRTPGIGELRVQAGYYVEFEFIPRNGYQLDQFLCNDGPTAIVPYGNEPNHYLFHVPTNNIHLSAEFVEKPDELASGTSSTVTGGNAAIPQDAFIGGSGRITVSDLSDQAAAQYDSQISDEYEIADAVALDMSNVFEKANDTGEWVIDDLHDARGTATISLELGEDFNPDNNVQIVHNNNGVMEYLPTTYDPETHTVYFNTTGFSDFIITTTDEDTEDAVIPEGFGEEAQEGNGNEEEHHEPAPEYNIDQDGSGYILTTVEEIDGEPERITIESGCTIPSEADIRWGIVPDGMQIVIDYDGEQRTLGEQDAFNPGHFVTFNGIDVSGDTITAHFSKCWVLAFGTTTDLQFTVYGSNGQTLRPVSAMVNDEMLASVPPYPVYSDVDESVDQRYNIVELTFTSKPAYITVTAAPNNALNMISGVENVNPLGANRVDYIDEEDQGFVWMEADGTTTLDARSITGASVEAGDGYVLFTNEFLIDDIPDDIAATLNELYAAAGYTDVSLLYGFDLQLFYNGEPVHETGSPVKITFTLAADPGLAEGEKLFILREHDGALELIEATYDPATRTVTFYTDRFSNYVLCKGKIPVNAEETTATTTAATEATTAATTAAPAETTAAPAETTAAAPAAQATAARTGEARSAANMVAIILITAATALFVGEVRKRTKEETT